MDVTHFASMAHEIYLRQGELNARLNPDWKSQRWPYYRAAVIEAAEAIGHATSWLWWKSKNYGFPTKGESLSQVYLELVDVLHFSVSMDLIDAFRYPSEETRIVKQSAVRLAEEFLSPANAPPTNDIAGELAVMSLQDFMLFTLQHQCFSRGRFADACLSFGMDFPKLVLYYHGKRTLNEFRWSNDDYKNKRYVKQWVLDDGTQVEDNVVLADYLQGLEANPEAKGNALFFLHPDTNSVSGLREHLENRYLYTKAALEG